MNTSCLDTDTRRENQNIPTLPKNSTSKRFVPSSSSDLSMATVTATTQKEENPTKSLDQQQPQQPPSDPPSKNADNASSTPLAATVTESSLNDVDESKVSAAGAEVGSTAVKDGNNDQTDEPVSDIQKKIRRAERFGMPVQLSEEDKRNSRAERFGTGPAVQGSGALKKSEEQKRKARAERFGISQSVPADEEVKKKARVSRFGMVPKTDQLEEDKKKARAIRFSQLPSGSLSQVNGKGNDSEIKTAIAGKDGGGT